MCRLQDGFYLPVILLHARAIPLESSYPLDHGFPTPYPGYKAMNISYSFSIACLFLICFGKLNRCSVSMISNIYIYILFYFSLSLITCIIKILDVNFFLLFLWIRFWHYHCYIDPSSQDFTCQSMLRYGELPRLLS